MIPYVSSLEITRAMDSENYENPEILIYIFAGFKSMFANKLYYSVYPLPLLYLMNIGNVSYLLQQFFYRSSIFHSKTRRPIILLID